MADGDSSSLQTSTTTPPLMVSTINFVITNIITTTTEEQDNGGISSIQDVDLGTQISVGAIVFVILCIFIICIGCIITEVKSRRRGDTTKNETDQDNDEYTNTTTWKSRSKRQTLPSVASELEFHKALGFAHKQTASEVDISDYNDYDEIETKQNNEMEIELEAPPKGKKKKLKQFRQKRKKKNYQKANRKENGASYNATTPPPVPLDVYNRTSLGDNKDNGEEVKDDIRSEGNDEIKERVVMVKDKDDIFGVDVVDTAKGKKDIANEIFGVDVIDTAGMKVNESDDNEQSYDDETDSYPSGTGSGGYQD